MAMSDLREPVLEWAVGQLTRPGHVRSRVADVVGLREGRSPWLVRLDDGTAAVLRVGDVEDGQQRDGFRIEAAVLEAAREHGIPTSALIAHDLTGADCGALAVLSTVIEGKSRIPVAPSPGRLQEYGAATAMLHRVPGSTLGHLPRRTRPIELVDFAAERREQGASALLTAAEELIAGHGTPGHESVLVHGDLWQGNTLWTGDRLTGFVDWDCAGVGEPGLDVASIRLDAALMFGPEHADPVLAGYLDAGGREDVADLAFWDIVAALSTPPRMAGFVSAIQDQGRPDLDRPVLEERRDAFLRSALARIG